MSNIRDLTGQTYGRLTAVAPADKNKNGSIFWEFFCSCGNPEKLLCVCTHVISGNVCSCGCLPVEVVNKQKFRDLTGQSFGRLTAIVTVGKSRHGKYLWKCCCSNCGTRVVAISGDLTSGKTLSCGCLSRERVVERNSSHGLAGTRTYRIWAMMIQRCTNPTMVNSWSNYGGRGIKVCERWLHSFENFLKDMGHPPSSKHSIERINNNGDYEPENCCWATRKEQSNNKRSSVFITYQGKTQTVSQWAEELGVNHGMIRHRLKAGVPTEQALSLPPKMNKRDTPLSFTYQGKTQTLVKWAEELEVPARTIESRFYRGCSVPEILSKHHLPRKLKRSPVAIGRARSSNVSPGQLSLW